MRDLWTVMRLELMLYHRGKAIWIVGLIMAFFGVWAASGIRELPIAAWTNFGITTGFFISLILTFATGDQVHRDRVRRLDGVLLSTPVSTATYVWGKYLAALVILLGLAGIGLIAAILTDQFYNWQNPPGVFGQALFPPLGPRSYIVIWCWLIVVPIIFGAALVLAGITITRGQRIVAYMCVLVIWITSIIFNNMPDLLDLTTFSIYQRYSPNNDPAFILEGNSPIPPDARTAQQVIHLVQANIPPSFLPINFLWNRLFFLALAVLLILLTVHSVGRQRQGAM
jgi:ABC-type transport system involved in multi-copper enzyme maturation permease subunit